MLLKKALKHIKLVSKHKWWVFKLCCKVGMPWRGLVHDLSKFSITEFRESIKYYNGQHSPIWEARKTKGYSDAWVHHVSKNKHHFQYWIDWTKTEPVAVIMPYKYVAEMICDRTAAGIVYGGKNWTQEEPLKYFEKEMENDIIIHEGVKETLREAFTLIKDEGLKKGLKRKNIKSIYKKHCQKYLDEKIV